MNFPPYFADAETDYKHAQYIIYGIPYDATSTYRPGAQKAPTAIRQASWNFETYDLRTKKDLTDIPIHDYGDLNVKKLPTNKMLNHVTQFTKKILNDNKTPIAIGGEHSITQGILTAYPKDIAVLSLDAHIDYRQSYENNKNNHACVIKRLSEHININNIAVLGIRSAEKEELNNAQQHNLFYQDIYTIKKNGLQHTIQKTKKHLKNKPLYLTIDIDVLDPAYAPATSTPEPFGLTPFELIDIIEPFSTQITGFDIMEVCPPYDHGQTALLAAKLLRTIITIIHNS